MITVKDYDKTKQKLSIITDIPESLANAIRRGALEIPILAIEDLDISKNDSALYDEIIAHRMGLIPLKTSSTVKESKFKLKATGPKIIYSTDIEPHVGTDYKLPLVILDNDQELEIVAEAKLGKGINHIKYSPGLVYYKHNVDDRMLDYINIDREGKVTYDEGELKSKNLPPELIEEIKKTTKVEELIINIESWGQIDVKDIFLKSIKALEDDLEELNDAIK